MIGITIKIVVVRLATVCVVALISWLTVVWVPLVVDQMLERRRAKRREKEGAKMLNRYVYKGQSYSLPELSDECGVKYSTLKRRLESGLSVEAAVSDSGMPDSVVMFFDASDYKDWEKMQTKQVYAIYEDWCDREDYQPCPQKTFTKWVCMTYPIKVVPTKGVRLFRLLR